MHYINAIIFKQTRFIFLCSSPYPTALNSSLLAVLTASFLIASGFFFLMPMPFCVSGGTTCRDHWAILSSLTGMEVRTQMEPCSSPNYLKLFN